MKQLFELHKTIGKTIKKMSADNTDYQLVELGFITEREYNNACEERDRQWELQRQKEEEEEQERKKEERELQLLKQLKDKYEK